MSTLVTGGAGYIGSHVVWALHDQNERVVVVDNLSTGAKECLPAAVPLVVGDVGNSDLVRQCINDHDVTAVLHFAGSIVVPESLTDPLGYYRNNVSASRTLLECCVAEEVTQFVFSSTAAVYGKTTGHLLREDAPTAPINPYGRSKLIVEWMLADTAHAHGMRYIALRYFNVAGADPKGRTGQAFPGATHLIKRVCETALGEREVVEIFGTDYPTHDGTGVRDYIHVADLADAHVLALQWLKGGGSSQTLNCGYGKGFSVRDVIAAVEGVMKTTLNVRDAGRRSGDPAEVVADPARIRSLLKWHPKLNDLDTIVASALDWEKRLQGTKRA
jgi:UDP-glucose 4-epimerase